MTIHRNQIIVALLAALTICLIAVSSIIRQDQLGSMAMPSNSREGQADESTGIIKAEVIGTLHFQEGQGYFISVRSSEHPGWENRVWLWITEDKILVRHLAGLVEKKVIAKGELEQMPENVRAIVPPQGMYLKSVEVEGAVAK